MSSTFFHYQNNSFLHKKLAGRQGLIHHYTFVDFLTLSFIKLLLRPIAKKQCLEIYTCLIIYFKFISMALLSVFVLC